MKIVCEKCESSFKFEAIKDMKCCPVCGEPFNLDGDGNSTSNEKKRNTYYYYKERGGTLTTTLYDRPPLYTFEAIDMEDAERQLKEVLPNSPLLNDNPPSKVQCPYCRSTEVQLVPKKFSILTGFATNSYNRVCVRCQRKF